MARVSEFALLRSLTLNHFSVFLYRVPCLDINACYSGVIGVSFIDVYDKLDTPVRSWAGSSLSATLKAMLSPLDEEADLGILVMSLLLRRKPKNFWH